MDKINFKYKDINFAESGAIVSFDKKKRNTELSIA